MKETLRKTAKLLCTFLLVISAFSIVNVLADEAIFEVTNIKVKEKSSGVEVNDVSLASGEITNDIVFSKKNESITYDITIKNDSDKTYTIKSISDDNDSENLEYKYNGIEDVTIAAGEEKTFELKITYKKQATDANLSDKKVSISLTYEDGEGNVATSKIKG